MTISESDEVGDDEWLLRRIHRPQFEKDGVVNISPNAFAPRLPGEKVRDPDYTGISLFRLSCQSETSDILVNVQEEKKRDWAIVGLQYKFLKELGLSCKIELDPKIEIKGHVVIPELCVSAYESPENKRFMETRNKLAEEAAKHIFKHLS